MSADLAVVENTTSPTTLAPLQPVDVQAAEDFMNNYQELVEALLDETDYQEIYTKDGIKKSKKKSAWRKLATAFNISDDVVEKEIIRDDCQRIISARYEVIATLPNGRHGIGTGGASIFDKISKKDEVEPSPFELRQRFTNAEHDIISTAHTRAKSRAIADLIGAGEVSAEELEGLMSKPKSKPKAVKPKVNGQSSTMGAKPKSKKKAPSKKPPVKPKVDDEAIEVEHTVVEDMSEDKPTRTLKDIIDSDKNIRFAVDELQAQNATVNRETITAKLLDLVEMGKIKTSEFNNAKALLE